MPKTNTIAVIEDEPDILEVLTYNLKREGYDVVAYDNGTDGLAAVEAHPPTLILLDLMLPGMDGLDVCRHLRSNDVTRDTPIIMVTAKGEESDIVLGLGLGADDYVTKPFSPRELIARVKAVLRRRASAEHGNAPRRIQAHGLSIDADRYQVTQNGDVISLTATEFRLLYHLASCHLQLRSAGFVPMFDPLCTIGVGNRPGDLLKPLPALLTQGAECLRR